MTDTADLTFTQKLAQDAGARMRSGVLAGYATTWKSNNTPVTDVDVDVNQYIIDVIHQSYPDDRIAGEELSLDGTSGFTWVVDPIDGTQALGIVPTSTICIARTNPEGQPLFSVIYNPVTEESFAAARGQHSTLNGQELHVSTKGEIKGSYIFLGSRILMNSLPETFATNGVIYDRLEGQGGKVFNLRSLSYGCLMVAAGKAEGAYIGVDTPYEAASVKLIIEGAGGKVTDLYGNDPGRLDGAIRGLIVSNGPVHNVLLAAVRA